MSHYLYRGITLHSPDFKNTTYTGVTLKPNKAPATIKDGIAYASDGNEFGIYMSDNDQVAFCAYGKPSSFGSPINPRCRMNIGGRPSHVAYPDLGIIYRIDPKAAINVRQPRIAPLWNGHYNNGFEGNEWIADELPSESYEVIHIELGSDLLHDGKVFSNSYFMRPQVINLIIESRCAHLRNLQQYIETLSDCERFSLSKEDVTLFRRLFGEKGVAYYEPDEIGLWSYENFGRYLLCHAWHDKVEFWALRYINKLITAITSVQDGQHVNMSDIIRADYHKNEHMRFTAMQRAQKNNQQFDHSKYDKRKDFYFYLLRLLGSTL